MIVDYWRWCYTAPCRWYPGGEVGKIQFYFAAPGAGLLPFPTVFYPFANFLDITNVSDPGEIVGYGLRDRYNGVNPSPPAGDHCEGTADDFAGKGIDPST